MNFYPFHIGDYISHTSHLSNEEDLAYRRMIDLYYQTEMPLPDDIDWIARKTKSDTFVVETLLNEFFDWQPESGSWHLKRADLEIAKYHAMQEGGRKGAAKRWSKGSDSPPIDTPMQTKNQEPLTINQIDIKPKKPKKPIKTLLPENFGISEAVKAWAEKNGHTQLEKHLESFINKCKANSYQYADWDAAFRNAISDNWAKVGQVHVSKTSEDKSWMFSNQGIEAKARELGVSDYGVANHFQLKEKILQVMAKKALQ